ncbi:hypothetical protein SCACP_10840 [Sporomusa carbonis]
MANKKEAKYTTGNVGVQKNPKAPKEEKTAELIYPPKVSTKHY